MSISPQCQNGLGLAISLIAALLLLAYPLSVSPIAYDEKTKSHYVGATFGYTDLVPWWKVLLAKLF
jgi:hypothetical protein